MLNICDFISGLIDQATTSGLSEIGGATTSSLQAWFDSDCAPADPFTTTAITLGVVTALSLVGVGVLGVLLVKKTREADRGQGNNGSRLEMGTRGQGNEEPRMESSRNNEGFEHNGEDGDSDNESVVSVDNN